MKIKRHQKILELIANYVVDTQEELLRLLRQEGFEVTQATVSRDIKELQLVKTADHNGKYRYSANVKKPRRDTTDQFYTFLAKSVEGVDFCRNFVVVKCHTGMANAVCELLDNMNVEGIVGTLSGDNTFFVMMREDEQAEKLAQQLNNHIVSR